MKRDGYFCFLLICVFVLSLASRARAAETEIDVKALAEELVALRQEVEHLKRELAKKEGSLNQKDNEGDEKGEDSLAALRAAALEAAGGEVDESLSKPESTVFEARGLGLQKLNPEISVTGDMISWVSSERDADNDKSDFVFRGLGLHFQSYLDPYTRFKAAYSFDENGSELGEAYLTRFGIAKGLNLTMGKFRQQFGVVNRWHKHALDQTDFPLALRQIFGGGGLNQTGISLEWTPKTNGPISHELTLQLTNGDNGRVFGENDKNRPALLARYRNYRDINDSTYFEFGMTGLMGQNDTWTVGGAPRTRTMDTYVYGFDFTLSWEPTDRMRYRNCTWRSEFYRIEKNVLAPDGSGKDKLDAWGFYSYIQQKVNRTTELGLRYDYFEPDEKSYDDFAPLAVSNNGAKQQAYTPYITFLQSPFVRYRLEYTHLDNDHLDHDEDRVTLQVIFAAGPHKHDRY